MGLKIVALLMLALISFSFANLYISDTDGNLYECKIIHEAQNVRSLSAPIGYIEAQNVINVVR